MAKMIVPLTEQIQAGMKLGETSIEGAEYLLARFETIMKKAKMTVEASDMIQRLEKYVELVKCRLTRMDKPWDGEQLWVSDFLNMTENQSKSAAKSLKSQTLSQDIKEDIAVDNNSGLLRAYSENGEEMAAEKTADFDTLYNGWAASKGIVSLSGTLYEADMNGKIKEDKKAKIKADPERVRALIEDSSEGYISYLEKHGIPPLNIEQHILETSETPAPAKEIVTEKPAVEDIKTPEIEEVETPEPRIPGSTGG